MFIALSGWYSSLYDIGKVRMRQKRLLQLNLSSPHICWSSTSDGRFTHDVSCPKIRKFIKLHLRYDELSYLLLISLIFGLGSELLTKNTRRLSPDLPHWFIIMPSWQAVVFYTFAWAILFSISGYIIEETGMGYRSRFWNTSFLARIPADVPRLTGVLLVMCLVILSINLLSSGWWILGQCEQQSSDYTL